ncbi:MAG TPA: SpoIID/LytB domain-containing protein [Solirubrobacteraceae bacterium]|nr:SpoIID/LytB domain-containing protein [Solirubrobacteraceae bacterium]
MRAAAVGLSILAALVLAGPASAARAKHRASPSPAASAASAASTLFIRGGGNGHGIGMSQYGTYGYALHGWSYQQILAHYYTGTQLGTTNPGQTVRVLLGSGSAAFAGATRAGGKTLNPSLTYDVVPLANGQLALVNQTTHKRVGKWGAPLTATGPGPLSLAGLGAYRGSLEFRPTGSGGVYTVNVIGLDDYVRGVIAAEMPSTWGPQALETQAVAARTYAITTDVSGTFYNLYPDTRSQMYRGVSAETPATDAAVAATSGQIVTYNGAPVVTYFSSSSGGHTENIEDAWPGASASPWLRGVDDPYDGAGGDPYHRWTRQLSVTAAAKQLGRLVKGKLVGVRVTRRGVSPRIMSAQVIGTKGATTATGAQLQSAFGLLSTWASFTTISGSAGHAPVTRPVHGASDLSVITQLKRAFGLVGERTPVLHGRVVPGRAGDSVTFEIRAGKHWRRVGTARLGKDGSYAVGVEPGVYRTVYRGLEGPSVVVR